MRKRIKPLVIFAFFVSFIMIIVGAKYYAESKETKQQKATTEQTSTIPAKEKDTSDSNKEELSFISKEQGGGLIRLATTK